MLPHCVSQGQPNVCCLTPYRAIGPMLTPTLLLYRLLFFIEKWTEFRVYIIFIRHEGSKQVKTVTHSNTNTHKHSKMTIEETDRYTMRTL